MNKRLLLPYLGRKSQMSRAQLGYRRWLKPLPILMLFLLFAGFAQAATRYVSPTGSDAANNCLVMGSPCGTLAYAISQASPGDNIVLLNGTYIFTTPVTVNKQVTIQGESQAGVILQGGYYPAMYFLLFNGAGAGSTLTNVTVVKIDKPGAQNIMGIQANNVTISNSIFSGQYVIGDPDVSRAVEVSPGVTGFTFTGNTVTALRQPAYLGVNSTGIISNNNVSGTKGFVVDNGDFAFTGNTFSGNVVDIAILSSTNPSLYTNLHALSQANNNAMVNDQRGSNVTCCTFYVDDNSNSGDIYTPGVIGDDANGNGSQASPYRTIAKAISVAAPGSTIIVDAGTYAENVVVNKSLTINGPNAGVNPCTGSRVAEAVVVPSVSAITSGEIFHVEASNVTIAGFTIDGDNTSILSGYTSTNGADIDAAEGVTVYVSNVNNLTVNNNIIQNLSYFGVTLYDYPAAVPSSGHVISNNKIQNLGTYDATSGINLWGGGVLLYNNQYAAVTNNCMDNVRLGVQTGNFHLANPGTAASQVISGNTMTNVRRTGIFHNLHYSSASAYTISNNTISGSSNVNETKWNGINLFSLSVPSTASGNTISATGVTQPSRGYEVWNVKSATPASISGGTVTNASIGVFLNNYDGYASNAPDGAHASISALTVASATGTGIRLFDNPLSTNANVQASIGAGVILTNGQHGIVVENASASVTALGSVAFSGQSGNYIQLINNGNNLDATTSTFNGNTGGASTLAQNFAIEDKIVHKVDNSSLGFVLVKANHDFVTINSGSIQRGVDAASNGFTVNVNSGTYTEDVNVNKQVSVIGAGIGSSIVSGPIGGSGSTFQVASTNVLIEGFTITREGNNTTDWNNPALNIIGVAAQGAVMAEIRYNEFTGLRTGIDINNSNGNNIHHNNIHFNRTGMIFRNQTDNTQLMNNFIRDNWTVGVLFLDASGGTNIPVQSAANSNFNNNDISGNWYGQIVDRQSGGALPAPGANLKNFTCNWYGVIPPVTSTANSAEPGYAAQIPVAYGGTATAPGGQPDILGPASANFVYIPYLATGTDIGGNPNDGFQPVAGCIAPCALILTPSSTDASCPGLNNGTASVSGSGGTGNYTYSWNTTPVQTTATASGLAGGTYTVTVTDVNGCSATTSATVANNTTAGTVHNTNTGLNYCTIQSALNAPQTLNGHTIIVDAGTYAENVVVNKSLTINGPNAGVNPCTGSRVAEAVVVPSVSAITSGEIFHVEASNVTIAGFTIDGDNTSILSGYTSTNGADIDAAEGVTVYVSNVNNLTVNNNIIQNLSYFGVTLYDYPAAVPSSGHVISNNKIQNLGTYDATSGINLWGGGVLLYNNQYAAVTNNCMDNVRLGVQTGNFHLANPGTAASQVISGNTMTNVRRTGIFHNLHYSSASAYTISNNTISGSSNVNETKWNGINLFSLSVPSTASGNTISATGVTQPSRGYEVWNVKSATPASISGGTVTNASIGVFLNNYDGYASNAPDGAHASISALTVASATGTGIRLFDNPLSTNANVQASIGAGVILTNGQHGIVVENASASVTALGSVAFSGQSGNYIQLINNGNNLDATTSTFNGNTGGASTLAQNFAIEDKIVHKVDNSSLGFVLVKANHDFVTINSGSIQRGVDAASNGFTVNVNSGTYTEDVNVNKQVSVIGAGIGSSIVSGPIGGSGSTFQVASTNVLIEGFTITREGNNTTDWNNPALNIIGVAAQGAVMAEIRYNEFTGLRTGIDINNSNGNNIHHNNIHFNRTGMIFRNQTDNTQLMNNFIRDNWTVGVLFLDASGGTNIPVQSAANSNFNNNDISGNWYGQIVDRQSGGALPAPGANLKNFTCNWYGVIPPVTSTANSAEPGYAAQIPVAYGGTATAPGGQPDILGPASANFVYIPYLATGTDIGGNPNDGFQPVAGCIAPCALILTPSSTMPLCGGINNGTASVSVSGGTGNYTYNWNTTPVQTTASASGLAGGTYTVMVTDINGCSATASVTITQPAALTAIASGTNVNCFGNSTGTASVTATGGTQAYTYSWNTTPAQTTASISGLAAGTYTVTITDSKGCVATASYVVTQPSAALTAIASGTNVNCFGNSTGTASVTATGGTQVYTYSWNTTPTQPTASISGLAVGTYTVTVTDSKGCIATASYTVTQPAAALAATASGTNVNCFGNSTGTASVTATGGTQTYTYSWNTTPAQTTASINGLAAGTYTVTITDSKGCVATASYVVTQPAAALAATASGTNVNCFGNSTGTASVTATGGTQAYTYSWNTTPAQTTASINGLAAGTYTVTITDSKGCVATASYVVTQPAAALTAIASGTNVNCFGNSTGTASVTTTGGTQAYTYSWNTTPTQTTASISGLAVGTYTVTVTDSKGCIATASYTVTQPAAALAATASGTNVNCFGNSTGTASVTATGGTQTYTYSWNTTPAQTTASINGLAAGTYTVTVTDSKGCVATASYIVTQPAAALAATASGTNVNCFGNSTGTASVTATGGTQAYTYSWNTTPTQTTASISGLAVGTYTVTVTDSKGCIATASYTVTQPAAALAATASGTNVNCFGNSTGTASVTATGGTQAYTYSWNTTPAQTTASINGLAAGTYTVTITDSKGCVATASYVVAQPAAALAATASGTNVNCFGNSTGTASVTATGGTQAYTYSWNTTPAQTTASISGLAAGTYTVTITDSKGCVATASYVVTQPAAALTAIASGTNVNCFGNSIGTASVTATGGTQAYTYSWNTTPAQTTASISGLAAGTYTVTVTDSKGCVATASITISQPAVLSPNLTFTHVTCQPLANGTASVAPTGGTPAYTYSWNTGSTASSVSNLAPGTYTVTVTDSRGCAASASVTITQPPFLLAGQCLVTNNICFGGTSGSATAVAIGGTLPYTYTWNSIPPQTGVTANNLPNGTYIVTVTDANGCTKTATAVITSPPAINIATTTTHINCFDANTGSATASASGGTGALTYSWNTTPAQSTATINNLLAGTYTVTVTDANGCIKTASVTLTQPPLLVVGATPTHILCNGGAGSATASVSGGTLNYTYSWNTAPVQTGATATNLAPGTYTVTVTDAKGCIKTASATITQPTLLVATMGTPTHVNCNGNTTGSATVSATGGTPAYTYLWNNGQTTATASNLGAGTYTVTVTDSKGCIKTASVVITQPTLLVVGISASTNVSCLQGNNGSATVTATGGTPNYTYSWSPSGGAAATASNLTAGVYTVTVTDNKGCIKTASVTITQPPLLQVGISTSANVSCNAGNNGSATVTVAGGTPAYTYSWNNGQTTATASGLIAGTYTVTVTDSKGCIKTASVVISQPTALVIVAGKTNVTCNGMANGTASVTATGGTPNYTYSWNTTPVSTTSAISGLNPGTYTVTVTDANGCVKTASVSITQPAAINLMVDTLGISCDGNVDGMIFASATQGATILVNGQPYNENTMYGAGTYTVTASVLGGNPGNPLCIQSVVVTLHNPLPIQYTVTSTNPNCFGQMGTITVTVTGSTLIFVDGVFVTPGVHTYPVGPHQVVVMEMNAQFTGFCTDTTNVLIIQPPLLVVTPSATQIACNGGTGSATVSATGGTPAYTYSWNTTPVQTTAMASNLTPGTYTVMVTDSKGCTKTASVVITQPPLLVVGISASTNVSCTQGNNGSATVTATGGTPAYTYLWNNGQTTATASNLTAGVYTVTVTDSKGCIKTASLTITQPPVLLVGISTSANVLCNGGTGSATVTATGGTPAYTYSWNSSPVQTTATATGLVAGTYTVTVTDSKGCIKTASVVISQPAVLVATMGTPTHVSCNGGNNGSATVSASGGTLNYTYSWNSAPVQTSATATGLAAGVYTVTVTDANNCSKTASVTITQPPLLVVGISASANVNCFNGTNGSATVTATGGTPNYTYSWNNGQITATATGLGAGTYTVTVTDSKGCAKTASVVITQPTLLVSGISATTHVNCFSGNNGSATVTASGGTPAYTYSWNTTPVQTAATATGLIAGVYIVTVTDSKGCTTLSSVTITQPTPLLSAISATTHVSCFGGNNGSATVSASGGTPAYTYSWNTAPAQTNATATGLIAGTYTVTITDSKGCVKTQSVTITQPPVLVATASRTNVSCNGLNNGTASVTATGGTLAYTYSWNTTPAQSTQSISGLAPGTYTVTVTDSKGCIATASVIITQPPVLNITVSSTNVTCYQTNNGTASVTATGGTLAYTYSWNTIPVQTTATATGLNIGTYTVTVSDANGCSKTASVTITQPDPLGVAHCPCTRHNKCFGDANGVAKAIGLGGTAPYTYVWNTIPPQSGDSAVNLANGTYTVTVTDANGCTATLSVTITSPPALVATITATHVSCFGGNNGSATVSASGGTPAYTYSWNTTPVQTTATISNLSIGTYTVTVTDANGCIRTASVTITQPPVLNATATSTHVTCNGLNNGTVTVSATGGTPAYTYSWNTVPVQTAASATGLAPGTYTVLVTDAKGCTKTASATITEPTVIVLNTSKVNVICNGASNGSASVTATGGTPAYTYSWNSSPVQTTATATNLAAGTYTVTVTDSRGCTKTASVNILQPAAMITTMTASHVSCFGGNNGLATVAVSGGNPLYTYSWNTTPVKTTVTATGLAAGVYTVTVTDSKGCSKTASVTITQPPILVVSVSSTNATCYGSSNGTGSATASGGTGPYTYHWTCNCAGNDSTVTCLGPGTFTVTVTDAHGCTTLGSVTISQPPSIGLMVDTLGITCNGQSDGMIFASAIPGATITVNGTPYNENAMYGPGNYTVIASVPSNVPGNPPCTQTIVVILHNPAPVHATITKTNATCFGQKGSMSITGTPGAVILVNGVYTPPGLDFYPSSPAGITYTVVAFNWNAQYTNICAETTMVTITSPSAIVPAVSGNNVACIGGSTTLTASATGGTPGYMFSLNGGTFQASGVFGGVMANSNPYVITVRDANMCTATLSRLVTQSGSPCKTIGQNTESNDPATAKSELKVYPNPSSGVFNIVLPGTENKVKLVVTDVSGKVIANQSFEEGHATLIRLELYNVAKGVYFLQVNDGDDIYRSKLHVD